ncbi:MULTISPECIES: sugar-phosphatase [unclassified Granulicatella]|uniref:sugar-phosphatase n=1 Tax=unclassified Granulicatella TaxID=2630493 RepID=UPI0010736935|nr:MULTISPECIES: sugar-phosphatase [unclassified Granulicatella]MBF0780998.1 sugar-phosphatase [Granulicatella sp. 19428wC4_WM01]TFU92714.1 sugar-phosphatase [Granulicatella sp. WM01]
MIKLIAIDIDGTLLNSQHEITPAVKSALQNAKERGIKIVLCTGRPLKGVQSLLKELELVEDNQYVITYNGSLIQSTDGKLTIKEFALNAHDVLDIQNFSDELHTFYHVVDQEYLYTTNCPVGKYTEYEARLVSMEIKQVDKLEEKTYQKAMIVDEPEILDNVIRQLPETMKERYYCVKSAPFYLEILHKQANKGTALEVLADYLSIDLSQTMAIGDNNNDIDMIKVAGIGVAMENATDELKRYADCMTKSHNHDGVAYIVNQYVND